MGGKFSIRITPAESMACGRCPLIHRKSSMWRKDGIPHHCRRPLPADNGFTLSNTLQSKANAWPGRNSPTPSRSGPLRIHRLQIPLRPSAIPRTPLKPLLRGTANTPNPLTDPLPVPLTSTPGDSIPAGTIPTSSDSMSALKTFWAP